MTSRGWFEVDRKGLAEIAKRRGMAFIVTEAVQNAWDEDVTRVEIELDPVPGLSKVDLTVRDDSPNGFRDLADSYMMFRTSYKLANPEQRGRFNLGEKLLLAVAERARITSTTGSVIFGPKGRTTGRTKTEAGSVLTARLRMTREEHEDALRIAATLIPPEGIDTFLNGRLLPSRAPLAEGNRTLSTEIQSEEGGFRWTQRKTSVRIYAPLDGEKPHLYEMGIPIDEVDCPWHIEIGQKVPLSIDRASIRFGYQGEVERAAAEIMAKQITEAQASEGWVADALKFMEDDEAVIAIVAKRFGEKAVVMDPSAPQANKEALDAGYNVVGGGSLSKLAWGNVRRVGALKPAGQLFEDGSVKLSPDGVAAIEREKWTASMTRAAHYAGAFAEYTTGEGLEVIFYDDARLEFAAFCGHGMIAFNVAKVAINDQEELDSVLIHECAHAAGGGGDHLTHRFHSACCVIGAKARSFTETLL